MSENIRLIYPIEMYYPDSVSTLNEEEQDNIIQNCNEYIKKTGKNIDPNDEHLEVQALFLMSEQIKQESYFSGVRHIVNMLLSNNRTPVELFRALFPNSEEEIETFKTQFADACDLILLKDQIDWDRMNLSWYEYAKEQGKI